MIDRRNGLPLASRLFLVVACVVVSACASGGSGAATAGPASSVATPPMETPSAPAADPSSEPSITAPPPSAAASSAVVLTQAWAIMPVTDVRTGETFSIADLVAQGKVVFAEPMAIWCSKCLEQQRIARDAIAQVDPAKVVWLGLDVERSESAENLAKYADQNDFPFSYAIASADLSRALAADFGDGVLSPPNVNVVVVAPDGSVDHMIGQHSADELVAIATAAGG